MATYRVSLNNSAGELDGMDATSETQSHRCAINLLRHVTELHDGDSITVRLVSDED